MTKFLLYILCLISIESVAQYDKEKLSFFININSTNRGYGIKSFGQNPIVMQSGSYGLLYDMRKRNLSASIRYIRGSNSYERMRGLGVGVLKSVDIRKNISFYGGLESFFTRNFSRNDFGTNLSYNFGILTPLRLTYTKHNARPFVGLSAYYSMLKTKYNKNAWSNYIDNKGIFELVSVGVIFKL